MGQFNTNTDWNVTIRGDVVTSIDRFLSRERLKRKKKKWDKKKVDEDSGWIEEWKEE